MTEVLRPKKYPGRTRVISRESARDILWRTNVLELPDAAHMCRSPVQLPAIGLPSMLEGERSPLTLTIPARCRRCEGCLRHRRRLWTARAVDMIAASRRTWFGTLTVRPEERFRMRMKVEARRLRASRETISSLDAAEQFRLLADELGQEATRWLKRIRSKTGAPFRYLLVAEEHKTGDPHLHVLLHEFGEPITKRVLEGSWVTGFTHWRLVGDDRRAAYYVCKYLSKDLRTRVRASLGYGQADAIRLITERIEKMSDTLSRVSKSGVSDDDDDDAATMASQRRRDDDDDKGV